MTVSCWACTRPATNYCAADDDGCGCPTCDLCDCACHAPQPPTSDSVPTGATSSTSAVRRDRPHLAHRSDDMKPYYEDDHVTLYHGDCRDVLPTLSGVGLVFTSPPYNLGDMSGGLANLAGGYDDHSDTMADAEYVAWQHKVVRLCWDALADDGAIFYNHKPIVRDATVTLPLRLNPGLPLRQIIVWYREMGVNWSPTHFLPVHEWILVLAKDAWRLRDKSASHASDVWRIRPDMAKRDHPAPFPIALPERAIGSVTADLILDPFAGSGSTLVAAKRLGRKAIGIELSERYCEMTAERLGAFIPADDSLFGEPA